MIPTNDLRFVERKIRGNDGPEDFRIVRILQQWHVETKIDIGFGNIDFGRGQWQDVPVEKEEL